MFAQAKIRGETQIVGAADDAGIGGPNVPSTVSDLSKEDADEGTGVNSNDDTDEAVTAQEMPTDDEENRRSAPERPSASADISGVDAEGGESGTVHESGTIQDENGAAKDDDTVITDLSSVAETSLEDRNVASEQKKKSTVIDNNSRQDPHDGNEIGASGDVDKGSSEESSPADMSSTDAMFSKEDGSPSDAKDILTSHDSREPGGIDSDPSTPEQELEGSHRVATGNEGCSAKSDDTEESNSEDKAERLEPHVSSTEDDDDDDDEGGSRPNAVRTEAEDVEAQRARVEKSAALNVACEALEASRMLNLELEFANVKTKKGVDLRRCTTCLRKAYLEDVDDAGQSAGGGSPVKRARSTPKRMGSKLLSRNRASPCLICGSPACSRHSCRDFRKEGITVCDSCSPLFSVEYLVEKCCCLAAGKNEEEKSDDLKLYDSAGMDDKSRRLESATEADCNADDRNDGNEDEEKKVEPEGASGEVKANNDSNVTLAKVELQNQLSPAEAEAEALRRRHVNSVLDAYDHALLLLRYSCQFIPGILFSLRNNTKRNNRIGLGSSATGLVSGIAGVAAAATIFTPVGPPLLIASLLFGGGATAASAGSEAVNYNCEPTRLANRIITLHGVVKSMGRLVDVMRVKVEQGDESGDVMSKGNEVVQTSRPAGEGSETEGKEESSNNGDDEKSSTSSKESDYAGGKPGTPEKGRSASKDVLTVASNVGGNTSKNAARHSSKMWSRATTNALRSPHLTVLTAGSISVFTVALEAREMAATVGRIKAGHPCHKADLLKEIQRELEEEGGKGAKEGERNEEEGGIEWLLETAELTEAFERYADAVAASSAVCT